MNLCFTSVLLLLFSSSVFGQSIRGQIQDTAGKPMPFASVLLLNSKDSSLVKGAVSDASGTYAIEQIKQGSYVVSASMVGYKRAFMPPITVTEEHMEFTAPLLRLTPEARQLKEVAVTAKRPFVEQQIDRTIVNVANSIIASGSTALEVLEKAPGVAVDRQNDQIQLRGKEGVIVQIDGKQTYLGMADVVTMLRGMSSDNIDQIELITNPSAKYDAAGNSGIINIRLKKSNRDGGANIGTNGTLSVAGGSGRYDREQASLQLNHRTRKVNLFGSFSGNRGGNYWRFDGTRNQINPSAGPNATRTFIEQDTYLRFRDNSQNAKASLDYSPTKQTTIGLVWTALWNDHRENGPAHASFRQQPYGPVYLRTQTDKTLLNTSSNQIGNLNLQHTFGKKGGQLSADVDLGRFTRTYTNTLLTNQSEQEITSPSLTGLFLTMPTTIDILTLKADYTRSLSKDWSLEAGVKSSSVRSDNAVTLENGEAGNLQRDSLLSNHFRYTEQVKAAYLSLSGKLDAKTQLKAGLRAEHTHSVGNSLTLRQVVTRDYLNLFPSVFLSRTLSASHTLTLSYSYRIDRPNYQNLNPARSYIDVYTYTQGNPYLKPQYTQSYELKHGFKNRVYTSVGASYARDMVYFVPQPVDGITSRRMPENIGRSQAYNLTVSFPVTVTKGWTMQTSLLGVYSHFAFTYLGVPRTAEQISGRIDNSSAITLGNGWTAELNGWLNTPAVRAITHLPWWGTLNAGVQKSVRSNLKLKLTLQDIFRTNRILPTINTPEFTSRIRIATDTRVAMLNLTYTFGNQQVKGARQRRTGSEDEVNRTN